MIIRPAKAEDKGVAVELIALSMGAFGDALFGLGDPARHRQAIASMLGGRDTRFSLRLVEIAEWEGQVAGLLLSFPGSQLLGLDAAIGRYLWRLYGLSGTLRFLGRGLRSAGSTEARGGEYYVSNLAVLPAFWGKGIASRLLGRAEEKAQAAGLATCSLLVEMDNTRARALYERTGFRVEHVYPTPQLAQSMGTRGHVRMLKNI
jgi:GNAT superfamily N-acetyltransferase